MPKLVTSKFRTHAAAQFIESVNESSNTIYYLGAHRSIPYPSGVPNPENSVTGSHYEMYDELIFGKHLTPSDFKHMIRKVSWTSGSVYDMYDDQATDLETSNFFVMSPESSNYHIFKCLNNNNGRPSTSQPLFSETSANDEEYVTADGYQWKYMYTISSATYAKFATNEYIPVVINADVTGNAVSGAIHTIIVDSSSPGSQYNSYASGTIKEAAVNGNTLVYALSSDKFAEYDVQVANAQIFTEGKVTSLYNNKTSNGIIVAIFTANNTVRITNVNRAFVATANLTSTTNSSVTSTIVASTPLNTALSANGGFYKNNSFYIRSGTGAGQLRTIVEYYVTGDTRRVLLNSPFETVPDISSVYEIGPRVLISGDGINANAVAIINPTSNSISEIEVINSGSDYTYADVTIIANTGIIANGTSSATNTTNAKVRAIIAPKGGHGSDVINELFATRIGIGASFANTETNTIPASNDFAKLSLIKNPQFANVELTLSTSTASDFTAGEYVVQTNTGASGQITNRSGAVLRLTNIVGFFDGANVVTGQTSDVTATVTAVDRAFETFDQRQIFEIDIFDTGVGAKGLQLDEFVIQTGLQTYVSDIVKLTINQSAYLYNDGEVITQKNGAAITANGIVTSRYGTILEVTPISGTFVTGNSTVNYVYGFETQANSAVSDVNNTVLANGTGYIHSLNGSNTNSTEVALTNVKGFFNTSDLSGSINTFVGQTNGATANLISKVYENSNGDPINSIVDGSGEILYIENFSPITRASGQTEKIKLIIEF